MPKRASRILHMMLPVPNFSGLQLFYSGIWCFLDDFPQDFGWWIKAQADGNIALPTHQPQTTGPLTAAEELYLGYLFGTTQCV